MAHKEMVYLKGFAKGRQMFNFLKAIHVASVLHEGQTRKDGEPYINHPMRVASALVALHVHDDITLAASILHDVIEDCNITAEELPTKYGISPDVANVVNLLTKRKGVSEELYYSRIAADTKAVLVKIADRCHNISTMANGFTRKKMKEYIEETETYIYPLCKYGKDNYPQYSDQFFSMKYQIESVCKAIKVFLRTGKRESITTEN